MKILVCVKQVPQLDQVRFQLGVNRIVRDGVAGQVNPLDAAALGHALALRAEHGGEVIAVTMGPPGAREVLVEAINSGVDRAIHLVDIRFAGADTLATARTLALVVARERPDLVLLGRNTVDGGTAQVAPQLAEFTGLAQGTQATSIEAAPDGLLVSCESDVGLQRWRVPLPAVVSVESGPAVPTGRSMIDLPPIEELDADALGADPSGCGIRGSATYVQRVVDLPCDRTRRRTTDPLELADFVARQSVPAFGAEQGLTPADATRDIWVVAEKYGDGLHPVTAEGIAAAHAVAPRLAATVTGIVVAGSAGTAPTQLAAAGAHRVLVAQSPGLAAYGPEPYACVLADLVARRAPFAVIGGWTWLGRDFLPRVAARLGAGMTGDVVGLDVDSHPGDGASLDLVWLKPAWAGSVLARVVARTVPSFGTLRPGVVPVPRPRAGRDVEVEFVAAAPLQASRSAIIDVMGGDPDVLLDASPTVLLVGARADQDTVDAAARLARERAWGLAGTAAAVAAGYLPTTAELALRKRSLSPRLVIGVGIMGVNDLDAVRGARLLVVVDANPSAEVMEAADITGEFNPAAFFAALAPQRSA